MKQKSNVIKGLFIAEVAMLVFAVGVFVIFKIRNYTPEESNVLNKTVAECITPHATLVHNDKVKLVPQIVKFAYNSFVYGWRLGANGITKEAAKAEYLEFLNDADLLQNLNNNE